MGAARGPPDWYYMELAMKLTARQALLEWFEEDALDLAERLEADEAEEEEDSEEDYPDIDAEPAPKPEKPAPKPEKPAKKKEEPEEE